MDRRTLFGLKPTVAKTGGGGKGAPSAPSYLRLATLTANVRRPGGRMGVMTVEGGVDATRPEIQTRMAQSAPRLRAAYAVVVQQAATETLPGAPPNVERLVAQLQATTDRVLGRPGARFLIGTVMIA